MDKIADGASAWGGEETSPTNRVETVGVGGIGGDPLSDVKHEDVEKDTGDFTAPHTETWTPGKGDSLGQADPVNSQVFEGGPITSSITEWAKQSADGVDAYAEAPSTPAFPDHNPTRVDLESPLKEEVGERTKTWGSDEFHITEPVTKGEENDANNVGGPIGTAVSHTLTNEQLQSIVHNARQQVFTALRVARAEIELGAIEPKDEFTRVAELETQDVQTLQTQLEAYSKAKTASVNRPRRPRIAGRVPSMKRVASLPDQGVVPETHGVSDELVTDSLW